MLGVVTVITSELAVTTWLCCQLVKLFTVTVGTKGFDLGHCRGLQRCMGIFMASQALTVFFTMEQRMTTGALRHDRRVVVFTWIVRMEDCMALPAVKLVFSANLFNIPIMFRVALPTLVQSQWLRHRGIEGRILLWKVILPVKLLRRGGRDRPD